MNRTSVPWFATSAALTLAALLELTVSARVALADTPTVLTFGAYGQPRPFTAVIDLFAEGVFEGTDGAVIIESDHSAIQNDLLDGVALGDFDGGIWAGTTIATRTPLYSVTTLPGLTEDGELIAEANLHLSRMPMLQAELREAECSGGASCNVVWVAPVIVSVVGYMGGCPVSSVADLVELPLRSFGGNTPLMEILGADPHPVGQSGVFLGILAYLGLLDPLPDPPPLSLCGGLTSWPATQKTMVFNPWCQYLYDQACDALGHNPPPVRTYFPLSGNRQMGIGANAFQLIMNGDVWDGLPPSVRSVMLEVAEGIPAGHNELTTQEDEPLETLFLNNGVTIAEFSSEDLETVRIAAEMVQSNWVCDSLAGPASAALVLQSVKAFIILEETVAAVDALRDAGALSNRSRGRLRGKLHAAIELGEQAEVGQTIRQLEVFLSRLDDVVDSGELSESDAQPLFDGALSAIGALEAIPDVACCDASCD